jgi:putative endonuclease
MASERTFFVYILASRRNGTLYVGVTSNLLKRVWEHKNDVVEGFTKEYRVHRLVWYESGASAEGAITREKQIRKWNRRWKIELIERTNPYWNDLFETLTA